MGRLWGPDDSTINIVIVIIMIIINFKQYKNL